MGEDFSTKIWDSPEWKKTRKRLLKDYCAQCNTKDPGFVLIHLKPMPKSRIVGKQIREQFLDEMIEKGVIKSFKVPQNKIDYFRVNICPNCSSRSLRIRKVKQPKYICNNCKAEFEKPTQTIDFLHFELRNMKYQYYQSQLAEYQDEINSRYQEKMKTLREWYLSGDDTATYCKKCAFFHFKGRILCKNCRIKYHTKQYEQCFTCNSVLCEICLTNRILKKFGSARCESCVTNPPENLNVTKLCEICKTNPVVTSTDFDHKICERCVLDGHWVD